MITIEHRDAIEALRNLEENSVDLVVTDPPYKLVQGGCTNNAVRLTGATDLKGGGVFANNSIKFSDWLPEVYRVLKDGTHCYVMCNDRNMRELLNAAHDAKFKLLNVLTWKKSKHSPNRYYLKNSEFIVMLRKGHATNIRNMGTFTVLEVPNVNSKTHPSEKPIELLRILIENSSDEGALVVDPFVGSGSTAEACVIAGRKFYGTEVEEKYAVLANQRIYDALQAEEADL